jgi:hypothetical protein
MLSEVAMFIEFTLAPLWVYLGEPDHPTAHWRQGIQGSGKGQEKMQPDRLDEWPV